MNFKIGALAIVVLTSSQAFGAAKSYYQAKEARALLSSDAVLNSFRTSFEAIESLNFKAPLKFEVVSKYKDIYADSPTFGKNLRCTTPVSLKITNDDEWNPEYGVDAVNAATCVVVD